jgi:Fe-S-cluster-containing hydrogenase component 2/CRP-like cAMP-binding protein
LTDVARSEALQRYEHRLRLAVPASPELLKDLPLFAGLPERGRDKIVEKLQRHLHVLDYASGEVVQREGEYSDSAFYVLKGRVRIVLENVGARARALPRVRGSRPPVRGGAEDGLVGRGAGPAGLPGEVLPGHEAVIETGEFFGELSALSRYPIPATATAQGAVRLLRLPLPALRMLRSASKPFKALLDQRYRERALAQHLRKVSLFASLDEAALRRLTDQAELVSFVPGQIIAEEGSPAEAFYLVRGGFVKVSVAAGTSELAVTYLRSGDFAGESALVLEAVWPFTLHALDHVELVKLGRADIQAIAHVRSEVRQELWDEMVSRLKVRGTVTRNPVSAEYLQMAIETGLIHGQSVLLIDLSTCTRCDECVRGCADTHGGTPRFIREGPKYRNWLVPIACYQCTDPVCMIDCPTGAITRELGTLEVTVNEKTCIGCSNCATRCPWGNIVMVENGETRADGKPAEVAVKCDLCVGRKNGPACVERCPQGSAVRISFKDMTRVAATLR